jgi:hypothetical protein
MHKEQDNLLKSLINSKNRMCLTGSGNVNEEARILFLLLTSILLTGAVIPCVLAQDYGNYETISLDPNNRSKGLTISLNFNDTLYYDFKATNKVTFWVEDPTRSPISTPYNYIKSNYGDGLIFQASSTGEYSLNFSLPQDVAGSITVEIAYDISRYNQPTPDNTLTNYIVLGVIGAFVVGLIVVVLKIRK